MPFTPFHMGPALAVKAVAGRRFSVLMFGLAQVAMDLEPGIGMITGAERLHGWTHTYAAATAIGAVVAIVARPVADAILRRWNREVRHYGLDWLVEEESVGWGAAIAGSLFGTLSHVLLDSIVHPDTRPFEPASMANPFLNAVDWGAMHFGCAIAGVAGAALWMLARLMLARLMLARRARR